MLLRRVLPIAALLVVIGAFLLIRRDENARRQSAPPPSPAELPAHDEAALPPLPGENLMATYGDSSTDPLDDLRALDRVISGYFSIIKNHEGHSIGGNEDLAAALRGENAYRQRFLPDDHRAFGRDGRIIDRWDTPVFVHPLAARQIELRSAGPDRQMFSDDDILLEKPAH